MDQTAVPAIQIADTAKFQVEVTEQFMMMLVILAILYTVGGYPQEFRQQMNADFQRYAAMVLYQKVQVHIM
tara:strand:+ start:727 stop:939 length:213 start_codon:yes stop_codon:yes gene_type:complete